MGRRRAGAVSDELLAVAEAAPSRRSPRLAEKPRFDYNEDRLFKQLKEQLTKANKKKNVPKSGTKMITPRKTKKDKETRLSSKGSVAVRITQDDVTTRVTRSQAVTPSSMTTSSRTLRSAASAVPSIHNGVPGSNTTPVSSRKHAKKQPIRSRAAPLATVDEDDQSMIASCSDVSFQTTTGAEQSGRQLKRAHGPRSPGYTPLDEVSLNLQPIKHHAQHGPATITPDYIPLDQISVPLRPIKHQEAANVSPDEVTGRARVPRRTTLFRADEDDVGVDDMAADETMTEAAMDDTLAEDLPEVEVPTKRRKKETTVAKKKDTVAKKNRAAKKKGYVLQRIVQEDEVSQIDRSFDDDAFANVFVRGSGEGDRSLSIAEQLEAGTLAIEDMDPEDRYLAELFSPDPDRTPKLSASLRNSRPLILSSSSSESLSRSSGRKGGGGGRDASERANRSLSAFFNSESEGSTLSSDDDLERFVASPGAQAYAKRSQMMTKSVHVRKLFAAARGGGRSERKKAVVSGTRNPVIMERIKIQYPGIAPLPVTHSDTDTDSAATPSKKPAFEHLLRGLDGLL